MAPETPSPPLMAKVSPSLIDRNLLVPNKKSKQDIISSLGGCSSVTQPGCLLQASVAASTFSCQVILIFYQIKHFISSTNRTTFCEYQSWPGVLGSLAVLLSGGAYFYREFSLHRRNCINKKEVLLFLSPMSWLRYLICYLEDLFGLSLSENNSSIHLF